jgi:hypothetical protein
MAGYGFQVVIDSKDPHAQADWWAAALGWQVESSDEDFIRQMIDSGYASRDDTTEWKGVLVWREGAAINDVDHPDRPRVLFQRVPEEKVVKNRVHLDLDIRTDDKEAVAERLVKAGATILHRGRQGPHDWITMADPEGNEFCVT